MSFLGGLQSLERPAAGRARFAGGDARESARFSNLQASWERHGKTLWAAGAGYTRGVLESHLEGRASSTAVERLIEGPMPSLFPGDSTRWRGTLGAGLERDTDSWPGGRHTLRVGVTTSWWRSVTRPPEARAPTPEGVNGLAARVLDSRAFVLDLRPDS